MHEIIATPDGDIQAALDAASAYARSGGQVQVLFAPGHYVAMGKVWKLHDAPGTVYLKAAHPNSVTLDANGLAYALELYKTDHAIVEDITLTGAAKAGLHTTQSYRPTLRRVISQHNGGSGLSFSIGTSHLLCVDCETAYNTGQGWTAWKVVNARIQSMHSHHNDAQYQTGALGSGGHKLLHCGGWFEVVDCHHHHNRGGLWLDFMVHCMVRVHNCRFEDNGDFGLYLEASHHAHLTKNTITHSGKGIIFSTVHDMQLIANALTDCDVALLFTGQATRSGVNGLYGETETVNKRLHAIDLTDNYIHAHLPGQQLTQLDGGWGVSGGERNPTLRFDRNQYMSADTRAFNGYGTGMLDFDEWQQQTGETGTWTQR